MSGFQGTLHVLCAEAEWAEVKKLVVSVINPAEGVEAAYRDWSTERLQQELMKQEGPHEWTPLMIACVRAPLDVIALLCHANPRACTVPDRSGSLPIHFCAYWRRGAFVEVLVKILCEASLLTMEMTNIWGQTPLHSLLDAKELAPIGCLRVMLDQGQYTDIALSTRDNQHRLPLHIAAEKNLPGEYLQALVSAHREAACSHDRDGNLPCHLLYNHPMTTISQDSMEALLVPLALGTSRKHKSSVHMSPTTWSQLVSCTKQAEQRIEDEVNQDTAGKPTSAQLACRKMGTVRMLPIHLGALFGVKLEIMKGICRQFPEGAQRTVPMSAVSSLSVHLGGESGLRLDRGTLSPTTPVNDGTQTREAEDEPWEEESLNTPETEEDFAELGLEESSTDNYQEQNKARVCALEVFERGRAFQELNELSLRRTANDGDITTAKAYFTQRADLLLAYNLDATNSQNGMQFLDDPERLERLIQLIIYEASENSKLPLSDTVVKVWTHLAQYAAPECPKKHVKSVGRIVSCLKPAALWRLTVVPMLHRDHFVRISSTGRTVVEEAELRAPSTRITHLFREYWFQYALNAWLPPSDALNYSAACRRTRAVGVRLLPQVPLRVTDATWEKTNSGSNESASPRPWQRLDILVTPSCTHTVFVTYYVESRHGDEGEDDLNQLDHHVCGGMLVVRDDNRKLRPNNTEPWGDAVVASLKDAPVSGSLVRLSFRHVPGRTYGLWHYNSSGLGSSLTVSDVRVRQLVHSCDAFGHSPLHLLLSNLVDKRAQSSKLNMHVSMLLAAKFGSGDSVGDVPLHYALKCGVNEDVLQAIISACPAALVETDKEGRTPMHAAFLLCKDEPPSLGVIRALLSPPGENAIKLKDSNGRLPLHIAAERGAGEGILRLLVDAYVDGCYRTNKDGDLPLQLLVKSGSATIESIEILLRPIMQNESICRIGGSHGPNLPLHIAADYQCSYKVLEKLLQTYGEAASAPRTVSSGNVRTKVYALDILEAGRLRFLRDGDNEPQIKAKEAAASDVKQADFFLRSDLIFVYNPLLTNPDTGKSYRSDRERIRRLENLIRREAVQCGEDRKINRRAKLTDMAKHAWIFLCTYHNPDLPSDNFAGTVRRILRGLAANAVDVLAHIQNPKSVPVPNLTVKECATPVCQLLIMSRLRFVGRYVLYDEVHPVHKSESCLVMRAKDHGIEDEYQNIMSVYEAKDQEVEDDISDAGSEPPHPQDAAPNEVTLGMVVKFASKLGVDIQAARREIIHLASLDNTRQTASAADETHRARAQDVDVDSIESKKKNDGEDGDSQEVGKEAFATFCRSHRLDERGIRSVVIKFMRSGSQFRKELEVRSSLDLSGNSWPVVPILDDYNVDRIEKSRRKDIDSISLRDEMAEDAISGAPENKDELYALDIQEKNTSVHNFAHYKYAVVMPAGDRDLGEISQHEELGILQIRDYMVQVGTALQHLHNEGIIHGDLKMENVVRFGRNLALIDFDGAYRFGADAVCDYMGGASSKFCTGVLPPEMVTRIDLVSDFPMLRQHEEYWRRVSEDAKDLNLLTPDDIQTICTVLKSLLAKAVARNLRKAVPRSLRDEMGEIYSGLENQNDWKDILSISLMTITFEDLPLSLSRCEGVDEFAEVWNRLLFHSRLWAKVKPWVTSDDRYAYCIKSYDDGIDSSGMAENGSTPDLPYELVPPSESIDVWGFGVLLYSLCSGGTLFHLGFNGDLRDSRDFAELFGWNKQNAQRILRDKIEDPLAQDLLVKILLPTGQRLSDMSLVLKHPFFGPSSSLEAQHILEKHEEQQLSIEETVVVKRMTTSTRRKIERAMERQCKILFDEDKIVVPTCLVVLPYVLDHDGNGWQIGSEKSREKALQLGAHLLSINHVTAVASFCLMLKQMLGNEKSPSYKQWLKGWTKRAKTQSFDSVCSGILRELGCGSEYKGLCRRMLKKGDSFGEEYIHDPMRKARVEIGSLTEQILELYDHGQFLYLVDEMDGIPVPPEEIEEDGSAVEPVYPIEVDQSKPTLRNLLLPFMNLAVMKLTASDGLRGMAKFLGLPSSYAFPKNWKDAEIGFVHNPDKPSTIAEFAVLHQVMRYQERAGSLGQSSALSDQDLFDSGKDLERLEDFFRDYDPVRTFSGLHRVSDGRDGSPAIWTTEEQVNRIEGELELASVEHKLRELKKEWIQKQKLKDEIAALTEQINRLQGGRNGQNGGINHESNLPRPVADNTSSSPTYLDYQDGGPGSSPVIFDPERASGIKRDRRKKMRIRPYFGVC